MADLGHAEPTVDVGVLGVDVLPEVGDRVGRDRPRDVAGVVVAGANRDQLVGESAELVRDPRIDPVGERQGAEQDCKTDRDTCNARRIQAADAILERGLQRLVERLVELEELADGGRVVVVILLAADAHGGHLWSLRVVVHRAA